MTDRRTLSATRRKSILARQDYKCAICGEPITGGIFHVDHTHCLALGGSDTDENWRAVHPQCNAKKAGKEVAALAKIDRILTGGRTRKGPPMLGSRASRWKKLMDGRTVRRD